MTAKIRSDTRNYDIFKGVVTVILLIIIIILLLQGRQTPTEEPVAETERAQEVGDTPAPTVSEPQPAVEVALPAINLSLIHI